MQGVDDGVGRIIQKLEEKGIRDDTLIIFTSDNGFSGGQHGVWGKGNATNPLNLYDTCVKVPCIFNMPGKIRSGVVSDALLSAYKKQPGAARYARVRMDRDSGDFIVEEFLLPEDLMFGILSGLKQKRLGFIVPEPDQIPGSQKQYAALNPIIKASSPYGSMEDLARTAALFREEPVDVVVTDCMGFTAEMGRIVARESGKQVLVPRLVLPKLIKALLVQQ